MSRTIAIVLMAGGALVALALCIYLYFEPLSGVSDTPAPLLTGFGALCILIVTFILARLTHGGWRVLLIILTALALILSAVAAVFMMHAEVAIALVVSAAGFLFLLAYQQTHRQESRA
ncbi:hypothetical protein [Pseudoroseicyclus tamaricis]|uniref:Uncharacterized protein n=1 Tax=Pseudoroseicyclus tamaricis TaxID=2705421 RepID=A0A6B2K3L5_9RHOB|nr:hypothetical protein [Pseudoroseicyclus tamaricis]NDV02392.1 hypothetical protein [Pseudoroseicyclus tamaricis]